jgi:NAD(P)-dependent dehydrogenase (short-subunit alcohol dehydrogenase family)
VKPPSPHVVGCLAADHRVDLTSVDDLLACCDAITGAGPLWALVYTAGRNPHVSFGDYTLARWAEVQAVNLTAAFVTAQALAPTIVPGGRIAMIVSGGAYAGSMDVGYGASKSGLLGLMKSLALNLADRDIRVNAISPGPIDTDMLRSMTPEATAVLRKGALVPRLGRPDEVAAAVAFLLADDNSYMTGATIDVNGGMQIR